MLNKSVVNLLDGVFGQKEMRTLFQPIVSLENAEVLGYESQIQFLGKSGVFSADRLMGLAFNSGNLSGWADLYRSQSIERYLEQNSSKPLYLNVTTDIPESDTAFMAELDYFKNSFGLKKEQLVFEICDPDKTPCQERLSQAFEFYRSLGLKVAFSLGRDMLLDSEQWVLPSVDVVKLNRSIVRQLGGNNEIEQEVETLSRSCEALGLQLVAESVKDHREYDTLLRLGVHCAQGNFIAAAEKSLVDSVCIPRLELEELQVQGCSGEVTLGDLVKDHHFASPQQSFESVLTLYRQKPGLIPVVENKKVVAVVREKALIDLCLEQSSLADVRVVDFMEPVGVMLPPSRSIESLTKGFKSRQLPVLNEAVVVADASGEYTGVLEPGCLLEAISDLYQEQARYANPLTGLPGRVIVDETVGQWEKENSLFVVAHISINELNAYNDGYGYAQGDRVIQQVASVLQSASDQENDILAHIHGGRFTLIFRSIDWFERCESAISQIDKLAPRFYSREDQREGGVTTENRLGDRTFSTFFSLSIGAVPVFPGKFNSCHEIFSAASEVEKRASQTYGGAIYVDQRSYRSDMGELTVRLS